MRKVGVHNYHKVSSRKAQAMDVSSTQPELASSWFQNYARILRGRIVYPRELMCYLLCSIGGGVVNNDELPVEISSSQYIRSEEADL